MGVNPATSIPSNIDPTLQQQLGAKGGGGGAASFGGNDPAASTQPALVPNLPVNAAAATPTGQGAGQGGAGAGILPQTDPLTPQQRAFLGYGGQGLPPNWATAMRMDDPTGGWGPNYSQAPAQASTPQDIGLQGKGGGGGNLT